MIDVYYTGKGLYVFVDGVQLGTGYITAWTGEPIDSTHSWAIIEYPEAHTMPNGLGTYTGQTKQIFCVRNDEVVIHRGKPGENSNGQSQSQN